MKLPCRPRSLFLCKHAWNDLTLPPFASVYYAASRPICRSDPRRFMTPMSQVFVPVTSYCCTFCLPGGSGGVQILQMTRHKWFVYFAMDCLAFLQTWKLTMSGKGGQRSEVLSICLVLAYCIWDEANYQKCYFKADMRRAVVEGGRDWGQQSSHGLNCVDRL